MAGPSGAAGWGGDRPSESGDAQAGGPGVVGSFLHAGAARLSPCLGGERIHAKVSQSTRMFGNMAHKTIEGKLLRVGHLGDFTEHDLAHAMDATEKQLHVLWFKG